MLLKLATSGGCFKMRSYGVVFYFSFIAKQKNWVCGSFISQEINKEKKDTSCEQHGEEVFKKDLHDTFVCVCVLTGLAILLINTLQWVIQQLHS